MIIYMKSKNDKYLAKAKYDTVVISHPPLLLYGDGGFFYNINPWNKDLINF